MERKDLYWALAAIAAFVGIGLFLLALARVASLAHVLSAVVALAIGAYGAYRSRELPDSVRTAASNVHAAAAAIAIAGPLIGASYDPSRVDADMTGFLLPLFLCGSLTVAWLWRNRADSVSRFIEGPAAAWGGAAAAIAITAAACAFFWLATGYAGNDEGSYLYESLLTAHGSVPFQDFISRAPAQIYAMAAFFSLAPTTLFALKAFGLVCFIATGLFAYLLISRRTSRSVALFGTFLTLVNPVFFITKFTINTTTVTVPLMLLSLYLIDKKTRAADVFLGIALAAIVLTREIHAIFIIGFLIYLIGRREWPRIARICAAGAAVAAPAFAYFGAKIGYAAAFGILLGLRHLGVEESSLPLSHSIAMAEFAALACAPYILIFVFLRAKKPDWQRVAPTLVWLCAILLFYGLYAFKRGFLFTYASEITPLLSVAAFMLSSFDRTTTAAARGAFLVCLAAIAMTLWPYTWIQPIYGGNYASGGRYDLDQLIGSGMPSKDFYGINAAIQTRMLKAASSTPRTILAGNLLFASENSLRQFMNITRPMAYEDNSSVYAMYDAAPAEVIGRAFQADPPTFVVIDRHLQTAILAAVGQTIRDRYDLIYSNGYAGVYALRTLEPLSPQKQR